MPCCSVFMTNKLDDDNNGDKPLKPTKSVRLFHALVALQTKNNPL